MSSNPIAPEPEDENPSPQTGVPELLPPFPLSVEPEAHGDWQTAEPDESPLPQTVEPGPDTPASEPLFAWYNRAPVLPPTRTPDLGDLGLVAVMLGFGWVGSGTMLATALHFHLFGISTVKQALADIRYTLGSQAAWYLISFAGCLLLFPAVWHKSFFAGLQWHGVRALRLRWRLVSAALICFALAMVDGVLMPGPPDTPIDQIFRMPGAAWMLFGFGITLAPLFEEIAFRGFMLPAVCTAYDWTAERFSGTVPRWPDENGHPRWSLRAMAVGSLLTSIPFALMHAEQTGYSLGPFLLLVIVSLVLSWARLSTRSLAASVLVHSSYNFLLFSLMLLGTGGFKHLDKM